MRYFQNQGWMDLRLQASKWESCCLDSQHLFDLKYLFKYLKNPFNLFTCQLTLTRGYVANQSNYSNNHTCQSNIWQKFLSACFSPTDFTSERQWNVMVGNSWHIFGLMKTQPLCPKMILNTRKIRPLWLLCSRVHDNYMEPWEKRKLNFHDGLQSYQLNSAGQAALVGRSAGTG